MRIRGLVILAVLLGLADTLPASGFGLRFRLIEAY